MYIKMDNAQKNISWEFLKELSFLAKGDTWHSFKFSDIWNKLKENFWHGVETWSKDEAKEKILEYLLNKCLKEGFLIKILI